MIPANFEYLAPQSLPEALSILKEHGENAKILAGGHSLIPLMKLRLAQPRYVVDISRIAELSGIRADGDSILIGSMTTHHAIESSALLAERCPLFCQTAAAIGDLQVRNRGTLGGSITHADPAADWPAALLCLNAELRITGLAGERQCPVGDFILDTLTTDLQSDEVVVEIRVASAPPRTGQSYLKLKQQASGFALVGAAVSLSLAEDGTCAAASVALTGVGPWAFRADAVANALIGRTLDATVLSEAATKAVENREVQDDMYASAEYRGEMARVYTRRALREALSSATQARR